jgi:hypothetical protein
MKNTILKTIGNLLLLLVVTVYFTGCEKNDVLPPGLSVETTDIKTFPGDEITLKGMASAVNGIEKIELVYAGWGLNKVYDLSGQKPKVFNYAYHFDIPNTSDVSFNGTLSVIITDVDDNVTRKEIPVGFLPDTSAPVFTNKPVTPTSVNFNTTTKEGVYELRLAVSDNRELSQLEISIPGISYIKTMPLSGKTQEIQETIQFLLVGSFQGTITAEDKTGNKALYQIEFVVIPTEDTDPVQDYPRMFIINADESPDAYLLGYYKYMNRSAAYKYSTKFYAPHNDTKIAFVPTHSITADYYGVSPYVSTKLINKNGYAVPIIIAQKGYYYIDIDIQNGTYSITSYSPASPAYTGILNVTGVGFAFADWTMSPNMTKSDDGYRYSGDVTVALAANQIVSFCFSNAAWSPIFRPWASPDGTVTAATIAGWFEGASGRMCETLWQGPGDYTTTFDQETMWATVSAKH